MNATRRFALALLALAAALGTCARATADDEEPPAPAAARATRVLEAFRAGDSKTIEAVATEKDLAPQRVADALLAAAEGFGAPADPDALGAAAAFAEVAGRAKAARALPAAVAEWRRWTAEDLARDARLRDATARVRRAAAGKAWGEAVEAGAAARKDLEAAKPSAAVADLWAALAEAYGGFDRSADALDAARRAAAAAGDARWPMKQAKAFRTLADLESRRGKHAEAAESCERAVDLAEAFGASADVRRAKRMLAHEWEALGRYADALALAERGVAEDRGDSPRALAAGWVLVADLERDLGQFEKAIDAYDRAAEIYRGAKEVGGAILAMNRGARARSSLERFAEAEDLYRRALADAEKSPYPDLLADALLGLGSAIRQRDPAAAVEVHRRSTALAEASRGQPYVRAWSALGVDLLHQGDAAAAAHAFETALAAAPGSGMAKASLGVVHWNLATAYLKLDRAKEAVAEAGESVGLRRGRAVTLGESFGGNEQSGVRAAADVGLAAAARWAAQDPAAREEATAAAFELAEGARATFLAERLAGGDATSDAEASVEATADRLASERLDAARRRVLVLSFEAAADPAEVTRARAEYESASDARIGTLARLQLRRHATAAPPQKPVGLAEVRAAVPRDAALVEFHLTPEATFVFVVTAGDARLLALEPGPALAATATRWHAALQDPEGDPGEPALAESLYRSLLAPLEPLLPDGTTLWIARDEGLSFVPFEAMRRVRGDARTFAIEAWPVAYVPSGSVWARRAKAGEPPAGDRLVALADPVYPGEGKASGAADPAARDRGLSSLDRLPATAAEARDLAEHFPPARRTLLLREEATRARLTAAIEAAAGSLRVLHLACHGFADARLSGRSGVVLSGADVLTLDDVRDMRVPADLVVLSACESGRGKLRTGEGVRALSVAFLGSGARRVVAAERRVGDEDARALLRPFYQGVLHDGLSPIDALRAAKLARIRAGGASARPYAWASFVLWD